MKTKYVGIILISIGAQNFYSGEGIKLQRPYHTCSHRETDNSVSQTKRKNKRLLLLSA